MKAKAKNLLQLMDLVKASIEHDPIDNEDYVWIVLFRGYNFVVNIMKGINQRSPHQLIN